MKSYDITGEELDDKVAKLEQELKELETEISSERAKLAQPANKDLMTTATIGVFAEVEDSVDMALIYAVRGAGWNPRYDVRVNMQSKETPVTLIYKAGITQSTGEAWNDVALELHTASPTFGAGVPLLKPWNLSINRREVSERNLKSFSMHGPLKKQRRVAMEAEESEASDDDMGFDLFDGDDAMGVAGLSVTSKGNINATFRIPGLITIPSDGAAHNFTIVQLNLDATMSWISVPKEDPKVHLAAKISNNSDYTLLPGNASVYVDGSFVSKSDLPAVSLQETFTCPLGLDPSVRITYHPRTKKVSQSGLYTKTSTYVFSQRVTIFNAKTTAIDGLKILDQVPVSQDSQISVKVVSPALNSSGTTTKNAKIQPLQVSEGVVAQWEGADEPDCDVSALGKDGKFNWVCSVPAQGKINLLLQWEVTTPARANVVGL